MGYILKSYSVKILYQFIIENEKRRFFEESIVLFRAASFDEALEKAEKYAESQNYEYTNTYGVRIYFRFYKALEAFVICDEIIFEDGLEVFSAMYEMNGSGRESAEKIFKRCSAEDMYILRSL
ncbi:MAG: DUF4288 domain-containing protein [Clostridium sp.]|nr:DUF4288 domain-containing protein [Clostridium sp.]MCM1547199.1 DUF4288 domain-containing protein [Ruminococcus sp.]